MVLESISMNGSKYIYLVSLDTDKTQFKFGRAHDNDIRINDISVSRFHASIKREKGNLILVDNNSKFGTLALVNKPL